MFFFIYAWQINVENNMMAAGGVKELFLSVVFGFVFGFSFFIFTGFFPSFFV